MLEEDVIDLMRGLEEKLRCNSHDSITNVIRSHFIEWVGRVPPLRMFEQCPKKMKVRNRDRITIIIANSSLRIIWRGVEVRLETSPHCC